MNMEHTNPLPKLLKYYRQKKKFTQMAVAKELGISRSGYANYEEGRCLPSIEQIWKLSKLLEHDLLFAYTLSSEYMTHHGLRKTGMVYDNISYIPSMDFHFQAAEFMKMYEKLTPRDQMIILDYMKRKLEEEKHE